MPETKASYCVPFIQEVLQELGKDRKDKAERQPPLFIGINGIQGCGKTTLVCGSFHVHRERNDDRLSIQFFHARCMLLRVLVDVIKSEC